MQYVGRGEISVPSVITGDGKGLRLHAPKNLLRLNGNLTLFGVVACGTEQTGTPTCPEQQVVF
jgi:hypothetical protein